MVGEPETQLEEMNLRLAAQEEEIAEVKKKYKSETLLKVLLPAAVTLVGIVFTFQAKNWETYIGQYAADEQLKAENAKTEVQKANSLNLVLTELLSEQVTVEKVRVAHIVVNKLYPNKGQQIVNEVLINLNSDTNLIESGRSSEKNKERISKSDFGVLETKSTIAVESDQKCYDAPNGKRIDIISVDIDPPPNGPPRPWGAKLVESSPERFCYDIWLSRYPNDPTRVPWTISYDLISTD